MIGLRSAAELGSIAFHLIRYDHHRPIVNGKCDRDSIDEALIVGVMSGLIGPINSVDAEFICDTIDMLIEQADKGETK